ncbi:hypothetical protein AAC387_Pa04g1300 [Persea americana]
MLSDPTRVSTPFFGLVPGGPRNEIDVDQMIRPSLCFSVFALCNQYKWYQVKLELDGLFENLEDAEKIQVYNEIIKASGRGNVIVNSLSTFAGYAGIAVILFTAGMMVWDIFSSEHILQTATHDAVVIVASVGSASLGEVVELPCRLSWSVRRHLLYSCWRQE